MALLQLSSGFPWSAGHLFTHFQRCGTTNTRGWCPNRHPIPSYWLQLLATINACILRQFMHTQNIQSNWIPAHHPGRWATPRTEAKTSPSPLRCHSAMPGGFANHSLLPPTSSIMIGAVRIASAPSPSAANATYTEWGRHYSSRQVPKGQGAILLATGFNAIAASQSADQNNDGAVEHIICRTRVIAQMEISNCFPCYAMRNLAKDTVSEAFLG